MSDTDIERLERIIDTHLAGYCEPDPTRRRELLDQAWHPDGTLIDPPMDGTGVAAIAGLADVVLQHYPDHRFERTSSVDAHHDHVRYSWSLIDPDGTVAVSGLDVADLDADGRLTRIIGFFGELTHRAA